MKKNFNITEWVDDFFTFVDREDSTYLPNVTEAQLEMFKYADKQGLVTEEDLQQSFLGQVALKRAEFMGVRCTPGFLELLASFSGSPGDVVMFLSAFRHEQDGNDVDPNNPLKMDAGYFLDVTKGKIPSREFKSQMWDKQKGLHTGHPVDNWLDVIASNTKFIDATRKGYVEGVS